MTSMLRDLRDLAKLLSHLAGLIVDSRADGGDHGGTVGLDHGGTPVWATVARTNTALIITELRRSYLVP